MNILLKKIGARVVLVLLAVSILFSGFNNSRVYASSSTVSISSSQEITFMKTVSGLSSSSLGSPGSATLAGKNFIYLSFSDLPTDYNVVKIGQITYTTNGSGIKIAYAGFPTSFVNNSHPGYYSNFSDHSQSCGSYVLSNPNSTCITTYEIAYYLPPASKVTSGSGSNAPKYSINSACTTHSGLNSNCVSCLNKGGKTYQYIYTDFGCVDTSLYGLINFIYNLVLTLAFMLAFAVIIFAGYLIMVSGGDPEKLGRGKSLMTKAIIGLLVIIFAFILLTSIGAIFHITFLQDL